MVRRPAVAGMFYSGDKRSLEMDLDKLIELSADKKKVIGLISPHAGYVYSGGCAGKGFGFVEIPDSIIILGVNHRGFGHSFAVDGHEFWSTPLGEISIDSALGTKLIADSDIFSVDSDAGRSEHSLEVQVPFIQYLNPNAKILPITISSMDLDRLIEGGKEIAELFKNERDMLIVASTDMSHYVKAEFAEVQDNKAIDKILDLDPEGLFNTVVKDNISMCGIAPTVMMLSAALNIGAKKSEIVEYTNSGHTSGDFNEVVAYLSMIVY